MRVDPNEYPEAPKGANFALYVNYTLSKDDISKLVSKHWQVVDVRLLKSSDLKQRQECVWAWLEGLRQGTLEDRPKLLDYLELEARACKMLTNRDAVQDDRPKLDKKDVDALLDFKAKRQVG